MTVKTQKWEPPSGSWENLIMTIDTVEKDTKDGSLQVYLHWNDGRKSKHSAPTCYKKAPQKMLHFYEMHLVFKEGTRKPAPVPGESPPGVGGKKGEYEELLSGGPGGVDPVADSAELETIDNVEEHPEVMEHTSDLSVEEGMSGIIGGPAPGANG